MSLIYGLPQLTLPDRASWAQWLSQEAAISTGVFLTLVRKKGVVEHAPTNLTYMEALEEALCYGWIDSQGRNLGPGLHGNRFTPRKANSIWSKRNVGFVEHLEREGRLQPAGRAAMEAAKADGRWDRAYSADSEFPAEYLDAVRAVPAAQKAFEGLNKTNRYLMKLRFNGLKTQVGREKRIRKDVELLAQGMIPHPKKQEAILNVTAIKKLNRVSKTKVTPTANVATSGATQRRTRSQSARDKVG